MELFFALIILFIGSIIELSKLNLGVLLVLIMSIHIVLFVFTIFTESIFNIYKKQEFNDIKHHAILIIIQSSTLAIYLYNINKNQLIIGILCLISIVGLFSNFYYLCTELLKKGE